MSTVSSGSVAESAAAEYLRGLGFEILMRNYKRRHCEIDIVARLDGCVYFVEVKYRATDHFGGGLDYIASQKLHRMKRAAQTWTTEYGWQGEYQLSAVEAAGKNYEVTCFIQELL